MKTNKKTQELIITGLRIHGITKISQVISQAAVNDGFAVKTSEFVKQQLMLNEVCHIRWGKSVDSPLISKGECGIFLCFNPISATDIIADYLSPEGVILVDTSKPYLGILDDPVSDQAIRPATNKTFNLPDKLLKLLKPRSATRCLGLHSVVGQIFPLLNRLSNTVIKVDAFELAQKSGNIKMVNFVMLGALLASGVLTIKTESVISSINMTTSSAEADDFIKALEFGMTQIKNRRKL